MNIITPKNPKERGCQLSIQVKDANKKLHTQLTKSGVIFPIVLKYFNLITFQFPH